MKRLEIKEKYNLYLKMTVSMGCFDNYNSFFNIFSEYEEACRRILVLTPYEKLEEVNEFCKDKKIEKPLVHEGNLWIKEYPMIQNPEKLDIDSIDIDEEIIKKFIKEKENIKE